MSDGAMHFSKGKAPLAMLAPMWLALGWVAKVCDYGRTKYADGNWLKGMPHRELESSTLRHVFKRGAGQKNDDHEPTCAPDCKDHSGLPHLAHAAWNCLALLTYDLLGLGTNDRVTLPPPP